MDKHASINKGIDAVNAQIQGQYKKLDIRSCLARHGAKDI